MSNEKLEGEYKRIQNYLIKHQAILEKYNEHLDDMFGISIYQNEVFKALKELKKEEEYEFFGKILVRLSATSIGGKNNKIGDLVDNIENFMPIKSEEDYIQFQDLVRKSIPYKENEKDIINELNNKAKNILSIEDNLFELRDIEGLLEPYTPTISLDIIKNLEAKLKDPFRSRSEELKDKYKSTAELLKEICGISKDRKNHIKNKGNEGQWKTNKESIGFKIS